MVDTVQTQEKTESTVKKVLSIVFNTLFYVFIILLLLFAVSNLVGKEEKTPSLFGRYYISVLTDSMEGNKKDSFNAGDMIVGKKPTEEMKENLKIGDIVTFKDYSLSEETNQLNTHRVVDVIVNETTGKVQRYILQGDVVEVRLPDCVYDKAKYETNTAMQKQCQVISPNEVFSVYTGKIKNVGTALVFLRSQLGFGLCVVLPTAILLILEGFFLVRNLLAYNRQKMALQMEANQEQSKLDLEAERERMRQELLEELKKENANKNEEE